MKYHLIKKSSNIFQDAIDDQPYCGEDLLFTEWVTRHKIALKIALEGYAASAELSALDMRC